MGLGPRAVGRGGAAARLEALPVGLSLFSDIAFVPWAVRTRDRLGVELPARLTEWVDELSARPSIARELEVVSALV